MYCYQSGNAVETMHGTRLNCHCGLYLSLMPRTTQMDKMKVTHLIILILYSYSTDPHKVTTKNHVN